MNKIEQARAFAVNAHRSTNHKYDGHPYEKHLEIVVNYAEKYKGLIKGDYEEVISAAWLHDVIEDCRVTYNDVKQKFGVTVAELVYACTNEKGRTRSDRANLQFYADLKNVIDAPFVKICDRLANIHYSVSTHSKMLSAYRKEHGHFSYQLTTLLYSPMLEEMNIILFNTTPKTSHP